MAKGKARTFGQDLMRGEHVVGKNAKAGPTDGVETNDLRGGKTHRITNDPYRKPGAKLPTTLPKGLAYGEMTMNDGANRTITGTSIFDPVLCELAYRWFCPPAGRILDPFAGGSVRGIVANKLGRAYDGIDLRPEQVAANEAQAKAICTDGPTPKWYVGDSARLDDLFPPKPGRPPAQLFDFIFSCPPYADLEVYSDDPRDLSTMAYDKFLTAYRKIIADSCARLMDDRFACFVIGDVRDKRGFYRGLPWHTIDAFERAGLHLYNQAILVTAVGSLPVRVRRQFETARKLGTTHQHLIVWCKGDPKKATDAIGAVQFADPGEAVVDDAALISGEETPASAPKKSAQKKATAPKKTSKPREEGDARWGELL